MYPAGSEVSSLVDIPPTILNGATSYGVVTNDWLDALDWIKNNTPEDAVIAAWWDYGYWISTMGERASLADNSTSRLDVIENIARMFFDNPDSAWAALNETESDYVLIFIAGAKINPDSSNSIYRLTGGGDESKKQWLIKIAGYDLAKYYIRMGSAELIISITKLYLDR